MPDEAPLAEALRRAANVAEGHHANYVTPAPMSETIRGSHSPVDQQLEGVFQPTLKDIRRGYLERGM